MSRVRMFDATLRDGSHAIRHQLSRETIADYCEAMDQAGMYTIVVGHGNGLGASSLQVGLSRLTDAEMLETARQHLKHTRLGAYMIPGFGTIRDDLIPAIRAGVDLFKIGCHCTEADITRQHIEYLREQNREVYGEGLVPFEKIPPGDYFMVETTKPDTWQSMFDLYRVYVDGSGWISIAPVQKKDDGKYDWPASTPPTKPAEGYTTKLVKGEGDKYTWSETIPSDAVTMDIYNIVNIDHMNFRKKSLKFTCRKERR